MLTEHTEGGYAYIPSLAFASAGVVALPGKSIVRAAFAEPLPLEQAFSAVERHLDAVGRPLVSLCGFELRMPRVLEFGAFQAFNARYKEQLERWGLLRHGAPPSTRTNVVPVAGVAADSMHAFSYTVGEPGAASAFIISGIPEIPAGGRYPDDILLRGERAEKARLEKLRCAVDAVQSFVRQIGASWTSAASVRLYATWPAGSALRARLAEDGIDPHHGIIWYDADPPVPEIELEIDVRRHGTDLTLAT
jgi:hypothetical protein